MNAHTMNRFGVIFVGTLGLFLVIAISTLVIPNAQGGNVEANYQPEKIRIVLDHTQPQSGGQTSQQNTIE